MPVDSVHPQYDASLSKWTLVRDCVEGEKKIKEKGVTYLPNPDQDDTSNTSHRYKVYKERAIFVNYTGHTRDTLVGMAFRNPPEVELPSGLDYLIENATGEGTSLEQLGKNAVGDTLDTGRDGLLADYPQSEKGLTEAQVRARNLQACIKEYPAESIINWKTTTIGGEEVLSLVTLKESYSVAEDEYEHEVEDQHRVLKLDEGKYVVEIWRDDELVDIYEPTDFGGKTLNRIPFVFIGTYDNNPDVDSAPLYSIAVLNVGHYRNYADYEEGNFLHGQPMLHLDIGTMSASTFKDLNPNGVEVGPRRGLVTEGGGTAQLLQAEANSASAEAMDKKEKQMREIGARLVDQDAKITTATEALIINTGTNSVLSNVVQNVSDAIMSAVEWCGVFMGASGEITYKINEDFYDKSLTAQDVVADIQLYDRGVIAKTDMRLSLRKSGRLERTDDEIDEEVGEVDPLA